MGLIDSIRQVFRRTNSNFRVSIVNNREVLTPMDNTTAISDGFSASAAVYSIVSRDADKFGMIPRYVYKASSKEEKSRFDYTRKSAEDYNKVPGDLQNLLNRPNEYQSQDAFFTMARAYFKVSGEAFIWLNRGFIGEADDKAQLKMKVLEMYVLPTQYVTVVPEQGNIWGVKDYILEANGAKIRLGKSNVIHWKNTNLDFDVSNGDHLRGMTPLRPGANTQQQYKDATLASVRMYQNDGAKGVLAEETPTSKTPTQENALRGVIDKKINNNDIKGAVAYLQGKWQYIDIGKSNTDLGLIEGKAATWKELCFLFGVPYYFFNPEIAYADANRSMMDWISNSIMPGCKQLDGEMNRMLPMAFGLEGTAFIASDFNDLPEVQEITTQYAERLSKLWMIKPNEIREALGYEKIEGLDEVWVQSGLTPISQFNDGMGQISSDLANQGLV